MADLLDAGLQWLGEQRAAFMVHAATYKRGNDTCVLQVTNGRTVFSLQNESGLIETFESKDFIFSMADLVLDGAAALPLRGDEIRETLGTQVFVHTVLSPQSEPCFRYTDSYRRALRVHTKVTAIEAVA